MSKRRYFELYNAAQLVWAAVFTVLVYLVIPLQAVLFLPAEATLWTTCIFAVFICLIIFAFKNIKSIFGVLISALVFVAMWLSVNEYIVKNNRSVPFVFINGYGWFFIVMMSLEALVILISLIGHIVEKIHAKRI